MKQMIRIWMFSFFFCLTPIAWALDTGTIGYINVTEIFNSSSFVKKANQQLQENIQKMEASLRKDQDALQVKITQYQSMQNDAKRIALLKEINNEQIRLMKLSQEYQGKVQAEQNLGTEKFTQLVKAATEKVAQLKNIAHVFNGSTLIYTDSTWTDLTKEVITEMEKH